MDGGGRPGDDSRTDQPPVQFQNTYDWSVTKPTTAAIEALATVEDVDPTELATELGITLHDYVNPEALDVIVGNGNPEPITVLFTIDTYQIRFDDDELVVRSHDQ